MFKKYSEHMISNTVVFEIGIAVQVCIVTIAKNKMYYIF